MLQAGSDKDGAGVIERERWDAAGQKRGEGKGEMIIRRTATRVRKEQSEWGGKGSRRGEEKGERDRLGRMREAKK
eukprot:6181131-Pleurochrysis_carterae.AAC.3